MNEYEIVVLGAGPAALAAAEQGVTVALIEALDRVSG